ncbi:MAG TPA: DNA-binding protein [Prosthecobacter sp.]
MRNTEFEDERRPPNPPLHSEKIVTERKIFFLDLKENDRGKFIKITEDVRGRRDTIILPIDAAQEFMDAMMRTLDAAGEGDGD